MSSTEVTIPHDWTPRPHQRALFDQFGHGKTYRRGCAVWHRRAGKDSCALNLTARDMFRRVGTYWHLFPEQAQARRAIWNGIDRAGAPDHRPDAAAGGAGPHQRAGDADRDGERLDLADGGLGQLRQPGGLQPGGRGLLGMGAVAPGRLGVPAADPGRERGLGALHLHPARPQPRACHLPARARGRELVLREAHGRGYRADHRRRRSRRSAAPA